MPRPTLRLLLDENLSPRIARALYELGYAVEAVQAAPGLGKATPDEDVLRVARERKQVVVTINFDMVLLCIDAREPVVWVDPKRKRALTYEEMVVFFFEGIPVWGSLLDQGDVLHALKTKNEMLTFAEARRRVLARLAKQRAARQRAALRKADPNQGVIAED